MINYYSEFDLDQNASCEEICNQLFQEKKKWIMRQNANSIERRQEAERKILLIEEAAKIFSDKLRREKYDLALLKEHKNTGRKERAQTTQACPNNQETQQASQPSEMTIQEAESIAEQNYASGNSGKNISFCNHALSIGLRSAALYNYLGLAYWENDDLQSACNVFNNGIEIYPDAAILYANLASLYMNATSQYKTARNLLDKALKLNPNDSFSQALDIYYMFLAGMVDEAEQKIQNHIDRFPLDSGYKKWVANAYMSYSDKFLVQANNGGSYYPSQEAYDSVLYYRKKANAILPDEWTNEVLEKTQQMGKKSIEKESKIVAIVLGVFGILTIPAGLLFVLGALAIGYFAYIPQWKAEAMELSGKRNIANTVSHYIYLVASFIIRIYYKTFRFILALFLGL